MRKISADLLKFKKLNKSLFKRYIFKDVHKTKLER